MLIGGSRVLVSPLASKAAAQDHSNTESRAPQRNLHRYSVARHAMNLVEPSQATENIWSPVGCAEALIGLGLAFEDAQGDIINALRAYERALPLLEGRYFSSSPNLLSKQAEYEPARHADECGVLALIGAVQWRAGFDEDADRSLQRALLSCADCNDEATRAETFGENKRYKDASTFVSKENNRAVVPLRRISQQCGLAQRSVYCRMWPKPMEGSKRRKVTFTLRQPWIPATLVPSSILVSCMNGSAKTSKPRPRIEPQWRRMTPR